LGGLHEVDATLPMMIPIRRGIILPRPAIFQWSAPMAYVMNSKKSGFCFKIDVDGASPIQHSNLVVQG
jgi:hypothetical protein